MRISDSSSQPDSTQGTASKASTFTIPSVVQCICRVVPNGLATFHPICSAEGMLGHFCSMLCHAPLSTPRSSIPIHDFTEQHRDIIRCLEVPKLHKR